MHVLSMYDKIVKPYFIANRNVMKLNCAGVSAHRSRHKCIMGTEIGGTCF